MTTATPPIHHHLAFVPAAGHDLLLPIYDFLTRLLGAPALLEALLRAARLEAGQRVLDVGCGTGTLLSLLARVEPGVLATGIDPDPRALARAQKKVASTQHDVTLDRAYADALPYEVDTFDRVFSTLMFHHLGEAQKAATLGEILRVLKPGGEFYLLDFAGSSHRRDSFIAKRLHGDAVVAPNFEAGIPARMKAAGFVAITELGQRKTLMGSVSWFRAGKSSTVAEG